MKWIRTTIGERAHVVLKGRDRTLCGIPIGHTRSIVTPGPDDRCENCDHIWRKDGKIALRKFQKRIAAKKRRRFYTPTFRYSDWERQS